MQLHCLLRLREPVDDSRGQIAVRALGIAGVVERDGVVPDVAKGLQIPQVDIQKFPGLLAV